MLKKALILGIVWVGGCATTNAEPLNEAAAAKLADYERTGDVRSCMNVRQITNIDAVDEKTLLIRSGVNDYYVSDLSNRCRGVTSSFNRIEYSTSTGQLCRNEILKIVDNSSGMLSGSCGMGSFEKLEKKPADAPAEQ